MRTKTVLWNSYIFINIYDLWFINIWFEHFVFWGLEYLYPKYLIFFPIILFSVSLLSYCMFYDELFFHSQKEFPVSFPLVSLVGFLIASLSSITPLCIIFSTILHTLIVLSFFNLLSIKDHDKFSAVCLFETLFKIFIQFDLFFYYWPNSLLFSSSSWHILYILACFYSQNPYANQQRQECQSL